VSSDIATRLRHIEMGPTPDGYQAVIEDAADEIERLSALVNTQQEALRTVADYAYVGASLLGGGPTAEVPEHSGDDQTCPRCRALSVFDRLNTGDFSHLVD
jgi:hypothetical protein